MGLVNDNCEFSATMLSPNLIEYKRELLNRGNYYLLSTFNEFPEIS